MSELVKQHWIYHQGTLLARYPTDHAVDIELVVRDAEGRVVRSFRAQEWTSYAPPIAPASTTNGS